jgi:hypothetical protein
MTGERDNICSGCFGRVKIPARSRSFTIEQIMEHHKVSCPARGVSRKKEDQHEESSVP